MSRRLLSKLLLCVALCVLVVTGTTWLAWPTLPLRKGMSRNQVHAVLGKPDMNAYQIGLQGYYARPGDTEDAWYNVPGNASTIRVYYVNEKVVGWEVEPDDQPSPSWLQRVAKAIGW
jgi:hypothetical protein